MRFAIIKASTQDTLLRKTQNVGAQCLKKICKMSHFDGTLVRWRLRSYFFDFDIFLEENNLKCYMRQL